MFRLCLLLSKLLPEENQKYAGKLNFDFMDVGLSLLFYIVTYE